MTFSLKSLGKYKYILLLIACAVVLLLLPAGGSDTGDGGSSAAESRLEYVLSGIEGVGRVSVLCSEEGAAVVCDGAGDAAVRLAVVQAVSNYTGLGSSRITVLPMHSD